jgi:microcystin-dependent protein
VSDFEELYDVIGTTYGSSDSTTFCLPDLVDKTLWGAGLTNFGQTLGPKLPNIKGTFRLAGTEGSSAVSGMFSAGAKGGSRGIGHERGADNPLITLDASTVCNVYTDNFESVQPPAVAIKFIIKY